MKNLMIGAVKHGCQKAFEKSKGDVILFTDDRLILFSNT